MVDLNYVPCLGHTILAQNPQYLTELSKIVMQFAKLILCWLQDFIKPRTAYVQMIHIEGSRPEWCISTIYHAWDTPFWLGTLDIHHSYRTTSKSSSLHNQLSQTSELLHATLQDNDCTSSYFPTTLWAVVNIKVIQTAIKLKSSVVFSIIPKLKQIGLQVSWHMMMLNAYLMKSHVFQTRNHKDTKKPTLPTTCYVQTAPNRKLKTELF